MSSILADTTTVVCPACADIMIIPRAFLAPETETSYQLQRAIECGNCRYPHQAGAFLQAPQKSRKISASDALDAVIKSDVPVGSLPLGVVLGIVGASDPRARPIGFVTECYTDEQGRPCAKVLPIDFVAFENALPTAPLRNGLEEFLESGWSLMQDQLEKGLQDAGISYTRLEPDDDGYVFNSRESLMRISEALSSLRVKCLFTGTYKVS